MSRLVAGATIALLLLTTSVWAGDWPMWRYDAQRSAVSPEQLEPSQFGEAWRIGLPALKAAWDEDPRLHFDGHYEPIVADGVLYLASSWRHSVSAYDLKTGERKWEFFTNGPVRTAPVAADGRLYFGSDDGHFYAVGTDGKLVWKFRVAPTPRLVVGNEQLGSVWPVRGGATLDDEYIYFSAGVWPFEGTLWGRVKRNADQPQPETWPLDDHSPQGHLVAVRGKLLLPGGRAKAYGIDLETTKPISLRYDSRGKTDYHVTGGGSLLFHGQRIFDHETNNLYPLPAPRPVSDGEMVYIGSSVGLFAFKNEVQETKGVDRRGNPIEKRALKAAWTVAMKDLQPKLQAADAELGQGPIPLVLDFKAGKHLFAHAGDRTIAFEILPQNQGVKVAWVGNATGAIATQLAADGRLITVTEDGVISVFAAGATGPELHLFAKAMPAESAVEAMQGVIDASGQNSGYALTVGDFSADELLALESVSELRTTAFASESQAAKLRPTIADGGAYGQRTTVFAGDFAKLSLPPYLANLVVVRLNGQTGSELDALIKQTFHCLRPYGGTACFVATEAEHGQIAESVKAQALAKAVLQRSGTFTLVTRDGALPGSANWTHEYGDPANTLMSQDSLVKAPLGVLWFGGPASSGELFYDRHDWPPSLAVINGRMFMEGPEILSCVDIYTGRMLWKQKIRAGRSPGRRGNFAAVAFHFLATDDAVYLAYPDVCLRIDPATGKTLGELKLPNEADQWGRIRVAGDLLLVEVFRQKEKDLLPAALMALDRSTGEVKWTKEAKKSFPVVAVGKDKVYAFDGILEAFYVDWRRKGLTPKADKEKEVAAFDLNSGKEVWRQKTEMPVTWLGFSNDHDTLIASNKEGIEARAGSTGAVLWDKQAVGKGFAGHPESVWDKVILWNDRVIDQRGPGFAYDIRTGKNVMDKHPLTGEEIPWQFTKIGHHCNYAVANPNLLTFRANTAGFLDLNTGGTARLVGFRSGCRNSLIPAGGILNAPNYAHGCICSYHMFTSLAFHHVPESEMWTYSPLPTPKEELQRVGVNFGAPGDRRDTEGTLWLDYPGHRDPSPGVGVKVAGEPAYFTKLPGQVESEDRPWVAASGVEGATRIDVTLSADERKVRDCRVRLYFVEPSLKPGERVFHVKLGEKTVLENFDVAKAAGGVNQAVIRDFEPVPAGKTLTIELDPVRGKPILCGVEVIVLE